MQTGGMTMEHYIVQIHKYSQDNYKQMIRKPDGMLNHPFIVPGSSAYSNCLWDWDSWLTNVAVRQIMRDNDDDSPEFTVCEKGCIINFLEHTKYDGRMPIVVKPNGTLPKEAWTWKTNIHKPCLVQHAAFVIRENGEDAEWLRPYLPKLKLFLQYYRKEMYHEKTGLYFWWDDLAIGVDNDPSIYFRPKGSSASIYLNCMMYRELLAATYICELLGEDALEYQKQAEELEKAVNEHLWDERNGFYYSADLNLLPIDPEQWLHKGMPRHYDCLIQRIDSWSGFMAMWAGIATPERAERMVKENLLRPDLFYGEYGVRTLAKTEKMYCIVKTGNPSCWLGPVWGISNYMCWRGLVNYGFEKDASDLAEKTIRLFGEDLEKCGEFHEYYHPDTGEGVNNQGFQNWNLLVNNMIAHLEGRHVIKEF